MASDDELQRLADMNLAESNREQARFATAGVIHERSGEWLCVAGDTGFPAGPWNAILGLGSLPVESLVEEARSFFGERGRGFSLYTRSHVEGDVEARCVALGMLKLGGSPAMVCQQPVAAPAWADAVTCETVQSRDRAADFVSVSALSYATLGLPEGVPPEVFVNSERWMAEPWRTLVAYREGEPVAAAMRLLCHGVAGIYWVGTVPEARGAGLAEAITRAITNDCFDSGAREVYLQASSQGEPIYRHIGYRKLGSYPWYLAGPPTP